MSPGLGATQARPEVVAESTERMYPLVDAGVSVTGVEAEDADTKVPLAVQRALSMKLDVSAATMFQALPV